MKKINRNRILHVYCKCGAFLVKYKKGKGRRLVKIHKDRIVLDEQGVFKENLPEGTNIFCKKCEKRLATVRKINGKYVFKLNQGSIGLIK